MSFLNRTLRKIGGVFPASKVEKKRLKAGSNLNSCNSLVLLCKDSDEQTLVKRRGFLKHLKGEYGVREVLLFCFTENEEEEIPVYLAHYKELDFFGIDDLNWRSIPKEKVMEFCHKQYDILIDLTEETCDPLEHVITASAAKMKLGRKGCVHEKYLDVILDISIDKSEQEFLKETEYFLSKFSFN